MTDTMSARIVPGSPQQAARLRAFLRWLLPIATVFGAIELVAWVPTRDLPTGLTGLFILVYSAALVGAWRLLDRGDLDAAVRITWAGIIVTATLIAAVQPALYGPLAMVPLIAVAVALPHVRGRGLVGVLVAACGASISIATLGVTNDAPSPIPGWFLDIYIVAATGAVATLVLVLLWQFSSRLTGALDDAVRAIAAQEVATVELETEHERLETTLRSIGDGVIATDARERVAFLNPVAERLTGWTQAAAIGLPFITVFDARLETTGEPAPNVAAQALAAGARVTLAPETILVGRSGSRHPVADSAAPIRGHTGEVIGVVVVVRDVSAERQLETERRSMERRIQETQKLESLGMLAGGVAHDFNNLLVAILGNASLALMDLPAQSPARGPIEQIELASRRAADLAQAMLAYSGRGRFTIAAVNINALVSETTHLIAAAIPHAVDVRYDLARELPAVEGDATQLRQLVMNLVINAGEAVGDVGGIIDIRTRVIDADAATLAATFVDDRLPAGRYVTIEVTDNGPGMDATTRAKLFQPFFSTKFSGRGLGLAAALGIVRGHAGAVQVRSEPGDGSTFRVLLPASIARDVPVALPSTPAPSIGWSRGSVLIVDDEPGVRDVAGTILTRAGMTVLLATDGDVGVARFREAAGTIDLVLLDLTMPRLGGFETFVQIREIQPDARIILMSGYTEHEASARFVGRGLAGFLQKPFTADELIAIVSQAGPGEAAG